jgi:hypothetical protein
LHFRIDASEVVVLKFAPEVTTAPISAEHATLRERIIEEYRKIEWLDGVGDRESSDLCTPESAHYACEALGLMFEERAFLAEQGVDWSLYDRYELD